MSELKKILQDESQTKIAIFQVAAKLFSEKGYNGVSMREISEKSNVSKPMIYYYFSSKEGIYKTLIEVGLLQGTDEANRIANLNIPAKDKLIRLIQTRFRLSIKHPEFVKFFLSVFFSTENLPFMDGFKKEANRHQQILTKIILEGINSGEFGVSAKPKLAEEIIGAAIAHFIMKQMKTRKKILTDDLAEEIVELLFKESNE